MSKNNSKGVKVKYFIFGFFTALVAAGVFFGIYKLIDKNKSNKSNDNNTIVFDGYEYEEDKQDIKYKCDAFKDVWFWYGDFMITNTGDVYKVNTEKKFSETEQNCVKAYDFKIRSIVNGKFIAENNKIYSIFYDDSNVSRLEEYITDNYDKNLYSTPIYDNDVLMASTFDWDSENNTTSYLVLKKDGILYKYIIKYTFNEASFSNDYSLISSEKYYEITGEKIKNYNIEPEKDYLSYIITDKGIYKPEAIDKKCEEYEDVKCEYKYVKDKYLNTKKDEIIRISYLNDYQYSYYTKTNLVYVTKTKIKK